ncbi:MAG: hypothetical protein KKF00_04865 [Proteobacteria bacterium]|nr:hypothetical protein [Pseudomonadota bacterium]
MKKFTVLALAVLLVVAFAMPASALENIFGGYWRTRFFQQRNFEGDNGVLGETKDRVMVDTRTRLYYTAKINDNLKFVNKFEMDTVWGNTAAAPNVDGDPVVGAVSNNNWGDVGTDGVAIEIKNSYADFNVGPVNFKVGAQGFTLARGFISNEDGIGMKAIYKVNDGLYLPFVWQKLKEGGVGRDANEQDAEAYVFAPIIFLSKDIKIKPYYLFFHAEDGGLVDTLGPLIDSVNASMLGVDFDAEMGAFSLWATGIMQFGDVSLTTAGATVAVPESAYTVADRKKAFVRGDTLDLATYLLAVGGKFDLGKADIHGQAFYATGDDEHGWTDGEINGFFTTGSTYYYWAEILGRGIFDQQDCVGSTGFKVTNIVAANLGAGFKPMDKLKVTADLWWARLKEDNEFNEKNLGIEADLKVTYQLVEGLTLDVVGAYLFAGDAVSADGKNENDPYEFGTRLSLSF